MINCTELEEQIKKFINKNNLPRSFRKNSENAKKSLEFLNYGKEIFPWITSLNEMHYCIVNKMESSPKCYICGNIAHYDYRKHKYKEYCLNCKYIHRENRRKSGEIQPVWNKGETKETSEKVNEIAKKLSEKRKGQSVSPAQLAHIKGKLADASRGIKHSDERKAKVRNTMIERHGVNSYLELVQPLGVKAILEKYGMPFPSTQQYKDMHDPIQKKTIETNQKNHGVDFMMQLDSVKEKVHSTKMINGTFKDSKQEKVSVLKLLTKRLEVFVQYKNKKEYNSYCDIYLPKDNLYIELNYHWTHGEEQYDKNNPEHVKIKNSWLAKNELSTTDYFKNAVNTWTVRDAKKQKELDKLNCKIFYNPNDFNKFFEDLDIEDFYLYKRDYSSFNYSDDVLKKQFNNLLKDYKTYNTSKKYTELILPFVHEVFYKTEYELLKNRETELTIIQNRCSYLHKTQDQLRNIDILRGFTISGLHRGYTSFSPLIMKAFIRDYNVSSVYDPFGGWGQRMIGAWDIEYHYNDANENLISKIENMYKYYNKIVPSALKTFSYEDAAEYIPSKKYDAVLTCPPYYDTEKYSHDKDSYKLVSNYSEWINTWWRKVVRNAKLTAPIFAYVISNKYEKDMNEILIEEGYNLIEIHQVSPTKKSVVKKLHLTNKTNEKLYVFRLHE